MVPPTIPTRRLLEELVALHEREGFPSSARLAERVDVGHLRVLERLEQLRSCELVTFRPEGYAPTVTAHELLELDADVDAFAVVDVPEEA